MTTRTFVATALRRWYVVLLGAVLTVVSLYAVEHSAPVYWGKVSLLVLPPVKLSGANVLQDNAPVAVAGLAVMDVTDRPLTLRAASPTATLYGLGEYSAVLVQVRNSGGQWRPNAMAPYIDIEAVSRDPLTAERRIEAAVREVRRAVARRQAQMHVGPAYQASLEQTPPMSSVLMVPPNRSRALGSTALTGMALTAMAVVLSDRLLGRRHRRGPPPSATTADGHPTEERIA